MRTSSAASSRASDRARLLQQMQRLEDLDGRHLAGAGAVSSLEARLARLFGMRHALAMSSATTAMLGLAVALEIRDRDVIVPAFAHGASVAGWLLTGNRLRFADVEPSTLTLDPRSVAEQINASTAAIVAVDWFGIPADSERLRRVADEHEVPYISDSAQALSARRLGRPPGWCADAIVVSFTTGKDLDAGEGGAVLTNRSDLYERLVWHTQHPHRQHRDVGLGASNVFGLNGRIHPLAAALADHGLVVSVGRARRRTARIQALLASLAESGTTGPTQLAGADIEPSFFRVPVACRGRVQRRQVKERAAEQGLRLWCDPTQLRPLYMHASLSPYRGQVETTSACGVAERLSHRFSVFGV